MKIIKNAHSFISTASSTCIHVEAAGATTTDLFVVVAEIGIARFCWDLTHLVVTDCFKSLVVITRMSLTDVNVQAC